MYINYIIINNCTLWLVGGDVQVRRAGEANDEEEGRVFILKGKKESEILFEPGQQLVVGTKQVQVTYPL
jgi:hypothetical protein